MNKMWALAAIALGLLAFRVYGCEQQNQGVLKQQIKLLEQQQVELRDHMQIVDTLYVRDTVALTKWRTRYNEVRDTVTLTDTVNVRNVLFIADSTIISCSNALETCEHRVALRDSLLKEKDTMISYLKKRKPSRFGCAGPLAATTRGLGLGVACGIRF